MMLAAVNDRKNSFIPLWPLLHFFALDIVILDNYISALNLNWSIVADMLLYVVVPTCRSTAEAVQILFSHAFGDAGSPYLIGVVRYLYRPSSLVDYDSCYFDADLDSSWKKWILNLSVANIFYEKQISKIFFFFSLILCKNLISHSMIRKCLMISNWH